MRRIDKCMNCGDERELVANGFCAKCYMARRREAEKRDEPSWASPDRSQRRYTAERNKMLINLTKIVKLVDETPCISPEDILAIKTVIRPYLMERAESLAPMPIVNTLTQESELTAMNSAEVNESTDESELTINSAAQANRKKPIRSAPESAASGTQRHAAGHSNARRKRKSRTRQQQLTTKRREQPHVTGRGE